MKMFLEVEVLVNELDARWDLSKAIYEKTLFKIDSIIKIARAGHDNILPNHSYIVAAISDNQSNSRQYCVKGDYEKIIEILNEFVIKLSEI